MILPSYVENMPLSILEAMAARVPIVSTRVGAIPEILDEGKVGLPIDPGDWQGLAQGIIHLLDNPSFAQRLGRLGSEKARATWDVKRITDELGGLYSEVLSSSTS
jgi:glycosyltransferase involved in cell wall biosynthesis